MRADGAMRISNNYRHLCSPQDASPEQSDESNESFICTNYTIRVCMSLLWRAFVSVFSQVVTVLHYIYSQSAAPTVPLTKSIPGTLALMSLFLLFRLLVSEVRVLRVGQH